jgi:hypothetical protein
MTAGGTLSSGRRHCCHTPEDDSGGWGDAGAGGLER